MSTVGAVVVGQLARDLVVLVDSMPETGVAADASGRQEMLGGKGANQAVALVQLGVAAALVAVAGDDDVGAELLVQADRDGVDVSTVVRRSGAPTGLIVELLDSGGHWRYLQHLPEEVLLTEADVNAASAVVRSADAVLVQLQQPSDAALTAARLGREADRLVVLDGVPPADRRAELLAAADVVCTDERETPPADRRAELLAAADVVCTDERETALLTGVRTDEVRRVGDAAVDLLLQGPSLLALGVRDGNLFVWNGPQWGEGAVLVPWPDERVVDTTGAGDAFTAGLTAALMRGDSPDTAAAYATAAAAATVGHPGGRPNLSDADVSRRAAHINVRPDQAPGRR
jgi:ribokinase